MAEGKVLVTGGAGFIGSNVAALLLDKGCLVRVVDDLSTGYRQNLDGLDVELHIGDIRDEALMDRVCRGVDTVFHLAACVGRQRSIDDPISDSSINVLGTISLLEAMVKNKVQRVVYSSSAAIFGELIGNIVCEDHPLNADSPYGVSKLTAEKMILAYSGIYGITGVCLRYFNIYGRNQRYDTYGNVIPIFAQRLKEGKALTIYGDGTQTRDFVNVRDVARANFLASQTGVDTGVYNLGSGKSISIGELALKMSAIAGKQPDVIYAPKRAGDVMHCLADTRKAAKELCFTATVSIDDGLSEYLKWFSEQVERT